MISFISRRVAFTVALLTGAAGAFAQAYPNKPVTVVVPYAGIRGIGTIVNELRRNKVEYDRMCGQARRLYESEYDWSHVRNRIVQAFATIGVVQH